MKRNGISAFEIKSIMGAIAEQGRERARGRVREEKRAKGGYKRGYEI